MILGIRRRKEIFYVIVSKEVFLEEMGIELSFEKCYFLVKEVGIEWLFILVYVYIFCLIFKIILLYSVISLVLWVDNCNV